ncbi:FAD-binding protein [Acaryochloris sp. IP29b_bin.148]|uniref:FAD-binding protein n=1 Tax=Acaryochloris sp. IP29b_bin.148 TaxID=2969218 RepID=UPI00261BBF16|nr:FAD-binding protein [Acaryochloris sp. IP29b_bin.148]
MEINYLFSWLKIRKSKPESRTSPRTLTLLQSLLQDLKSKGKPYNFVGSSHSYNGIQLVDDNVAVIFDSNDLKNIAYNYDTQEVTVEAAVTIEELKRFLQPLGRQLISSGNFMQQRVVGALVTGTHGYGVEDVIMADSITAVTLLDEDGCPHTLTEQEHGNVLKYVRVSLGYLGVIVSLTLRTKKNEQFEVTQQIFQLSQLPQTLAQYGNKAHAMTMFPYSDKADPFIGFISLDKLDQYKEPAPVNRANAFVTAISWVIITFVWKLNAQLPIFQEFLQMLIGRFAPSVEPEVIVTSPDDLDYLYDYHPMLESERNPSIPQRILSSTYTAYNVAVFIPKADLPDLLLFLFELAQKMKQANPQQYFKNSIGVRYVGQSQKCAMAGNYKQDSYAVDLFFSKTDLELAEQVQDKVAQKFKIRPHWGKTILKPEVIQNINLDDLKEFSNLRAKYNPSNLLQPNLGGIKF